jgi:diguanylate cyclase
MKLYLTRRVFPSLKRNMLLLAISTSAFIIFLFIFQTLINAESEKAKSRLSIETADHINSLKIHVDRELNALLSVSNGLASYITVYHKELDDDKLLAMLASLFKQTRHVRSFGISVGYRIQYVYPVQANAKALGVDYREVANQWPQVKLAVESHQGVLAGPIQLVQGGSALIYRYPVYINNEFWGIVSTVINTNSLMQAAFNNIAQPEFEFAIRGKLPSTQTKNVFWGDASLFNQPTALITTSVMPNAVWEWAIVKKNSPQSRLIIILEVMSWVTSFLLASALFLLLKDRDKLAEKASQDSLTGLANRNVLHQKIEQALNYSRRHEKLMAVFFIDIDHFKRINDTYGHETGDEVLKATADKLLSYIRDKDTLSRLGGDELVIVLRDFNQIENVSNLARRIIHAFQTTLPIGNQEIDVKLSIGIAVSFPLAKENVKSLMRKADLALYEVKHHGKNGFKIFSDNKKD